ncbi:MAG TPA: DUF4382 domain-containing protein [Candidatus Thermoplasmatota archaeon]|nr:DUF4382 domain-containing protein [Candidatus Thermoplasmatota archaeon]
MLHKTLVAGLLAMTAVALSGCSSGDGASASIYVKDAATDEFDEIHVVFNEVSIHQSQSADPEVGAGWKTLFSDEAGQDVDLLDASGNRAAFLGEAGLGAGHYQQIRVNVTAAYGVRDGVRTDFTVEKETLKFSGSFRVAEGNETRIVLDIDLDQSVDQDGSTWTFSGKGHTTAEQVKDSESGDDADDQGEVVEL